jgi:hypothetical protein
VYQRVYNTVCVVHCDHRYSDLFLVADNCVRVSEIGKEFVSAQEGGLIVSAVIVFRACEVDQYEVGNWVIIYIIIRVGGLVIVEVLFAESLGGLMINILFAYIIAIRVVCSILCVLLVLYRGLISILWCWSVVIIPSEHVSGFGSIVYTVCEIVL